MNDENSKLSDDSAASQSEEISSREGRPGNLCLPLHVHLCRGGVLGSDLSAEDCAAFLVPQVNLLWSPAGVSFELVAVTEHEWPESVNGEALVDIRGQIWALTRDASSGEKAGRKTRRRLFLDQLIGPSNLSPESFDIWMFDFIGQQSQGCCIDRESRTIIMGRRSTKGYSQATRRPLACLAKTMAHELGHALGLNHPRGRKFADGTSCTAATGMNNLMIGGIDAAGGGGELLCPWQILLARQCAKSFLAAMTTTGQLGDTESHDNIKICEKDEALSIQPTGKEVQSSLSAPQRTVTQMDALQWLADFPDAQLPGEVFTSVPDISELHYMFPSPQKFTQNYEHYKDWFQRAVSLILSKTPRYGLFLQTDIRALSADEKVLEFIDKSALIQEVALTCHFTLIWHKIVTNSEHFAQKRVSHAPNWSHLLCLQREGVPAYETRHWKTPDVFTRGDMTWERAIGLNVAMTGVSFLKHVARATTVVDPFCGLGTVLAVANAVDLHSVGNDLSRKRAKKASELDMRYALCSLGFKRREHYGVTERLPYDKDTVPRPADSLRPTADDNTTTTTCSTAAISSAVASTR